MEIRDAGLVSDSAECNQSLNCFRIIPMVHGTILMVLALYKAAEYWKISAGFKGFTLVKILIRDQAIYFML